MTYTEKTDRYLCLSVATTAQFFAVFVHMTNLTMMIAIAISNITLGLLHIIRYNIKATNFNLKNVVYLFFAIVMLAPNITTPLTLISNPVTCYLAIVSGNAQRKKMGKELFKYNLLDVLLIQAIALPVTFLVTGDYQAYWIFSLFN